ncbi:glycine cleavage system H protein, partial [Schistosoma bovis]
YTKKHEWIKVSGDVGIVGISKYAEQKLGDIVYVELPTIGDKINVNDQCAVVESVKAVSEVYSPVSGTIIEVNPDVEKNTKIINQSPLDEGTLCVFESSGCIQTFSVDMKSYFSKRSSENSAV